MRQYSGYACLEHPRFIKVKNRRISTSLMTSVASGYQKDLPQTTSVSTATTLIYTTGAGIAAAAGTRLALQLLLTKLFKFCPFQSQD
jgi:hypothetical protein